MSAHAADDSPRAQASPASRIRLRAAGSLGPRWSSSIWGCGPRSGAGGGRGRHQPHTSPFRRMLISTTDRWLVLDARINRSEPITSRNPRIRVLQLPETPRHHAHHCPGSANERSQRMFPKTSVSAGERGSSGQGQDRTGDLPLFRCSRHPDPGMFPQRGRMPTCASGRGLLPSLSSPLPSASQ